ncbi:MAG: FAD-binding oxidoreductase [Hydrogenophaga sp.]
MNPVSAWGRLSAHPHRLMFLSDPSTVAQRLAESTLPGLAHGMGRSYGDSCLNPEGTLWMTRGLDHFIAFDPDTGRLVCEAGVLLRDIQRLVVQRGWLLPVTPGTQMVTVGGAIANDVHGKNHHAQGSFGDHVLGLTLVRTDGQTLRCSPSERADWFAATVGGLGLTGVITQAELQLRRVSGPWMDTETLPYGSLDQFFAISDHSDADWEHGVSWIDCLSGAGSRGLFMRANHSSATSGPAAPKRHRRMPFVPPISLINRLSLRPLNTAYFNLKRWQTGLALAHVEPFNYPLDNLKDWNRMYGPRGFYQYQCVVPRSVGPDAMTAMLQAIQRSGQGSFLAVLKTFGQRTAPGLLSFPMPGVTLALDFPNRGDDTHRLMDRLDAIVREAKGRLYAAKDARMPKDLWMSGYPRLNEFLAFRDPGISSGFSRRVMDF